MVNNHILTCHDHIHRMLMLSSKKINLLHTPTHTPETFHHIHFSGYSTKPAFFNQSCTLENAATVCKSFLFLPLNQCKKLTGV